MMTVFGRLKPEVRLAQAQADMSTIANRMESANPDVYPKGDGYGVAVAPLQQDLTRRARPTLSRTSWGSGFVLLIASANVANLILARILKRNANWRSARIGRNQSPAGTSAAYRNNSALAAQAERLGSNWRLTLLPLLVKFAARFTTRAR